MSRRVCRDMPDFAWNCTVAVLRFAMFTPFFLLANKALYLPWFAVSDERPLPSCHPRVAASPYAVSECVWSPERGAFVPVPVPWAQTPYRSQCAWGYDACVWCMILSWMLIMSATTLPFLIERSERASGINSIDTNTRVRTRMTQLAGLCMVAFGAIVLSWAISCGRAWPRQTFTAAWYLVFVVAFAVGSLLVLDMPRYPERLPCRRAAIDASARPR